ncbi:DUF1697 domain-containing protein [Clostridium manihotivorum]|uniref:Cytoplasmic protein n=1 Tax=Clostridium manihotivorum TaxID=2320868 RepID=A0A410DTM4_9CLOT|nr:DUF1697 domain-containing protein [Clostridium manihotivorum]QAA32464.1 cytoplasmic protein [Clostridium manihotivorum]
MGVYIALLRGINVGTKNRIKMSELKEYFENLGYTNVKTYIQSGNVIFRSELDENQIKEQLESNFEDRFGFSTKMILRSSEELNNIIRNLPFSEEDIEKAESTSEGESLYVSLMQQVPLEENIKLLEAYKNEYDKYEVIGRDVYLLFGKSIRNSKLATNLTKLKVTDTVRNWKTLSKLVSLVDEI